MNHAQLIALGRSLRVAGEHGQRLDDSATAPNTAEIRQDLERALALLEDAVTTAKPTTRCPEHPTGPVDPDAADLCLLCETRRRSGQRTTRPYSADMDDEAPPERVQSRHRIRADQPQPKKRWIPEMWNGQAWQVCGTPRTSEQEAEQYLGQLRQSPDAASAYRLVYAFTDHQVLRVWGTPTVTPRQPPEL
ncbi:hypothetical protein [Streptomyces chartreusis]|uniref:hypothetical protein n=1 Tax=Streptomyces chartreusis TaxID=1969 RepID=UPI002F910C28|nr:hypothetical protein OG938_47180 [Streptomyces chartreusis]WTA33606.1 hypothetical protein OIA45_47625 [Streptomyces chartreusis]